MAGRGRVGRSVQLGRAAASLARLKLSGDPRGAVRDSVVAQLGSLHGLPQKIGQILSLGELDANERHWTALAESGEALPPGVALREIEARLGCRLESAFRSLDPVGRAASLAQVHRGVLHDGREVAVKLQYPGMVEALGLDVRALEWLTAPFGGMRRGFNLEAWRREIAEMLRRELDYRAEAETIEAVRRHAAGWRLLQVPEPVAELSGPTVLTMTWVAGSPFQDARRWGVDQRRLLAEGLIRLFLRSVFRWRLVHADPHPGNYRFRSEPQGPVVGLIDFGCVKALEPGFTGALAGLIVGAARGERESDDRIFSRWVELGFDGDLLAPLRGRLPAVGRLLFEPFAAEHAFDVRAWDLGPRLAAALGDDRAAFRTAGPPALIFLIRAWQGLTRYLAALDAPVAWRPLLEELGTLPEPGAPDPPRARLEESGGHGAGVARAEAAQTLRIAVSDGGCTRVALTFRAQTAGWLEELIPDDVAARCAERGIDVVGLGRRAAAGGFAPGELFALRDGTRDIRVWLE